MPDLHARRTRRRRLGRAPLAAILAAVVLLIACAPASAATNPCEGPVATNFLAADATHPGVISLFFFGAQGARVSYFECIKGRARRLGSARSEPGTASILHDATTWSCDRLTRDFVATSPRPDGTLAVGTYSVRTVSCDRRFELKTPRRVARGEMLRVRVSDTWGIGGLRPQLCVTSPRGKRGCSELRFPRAVGVASRRFRVNTRGRVRVELRIRDRGVRRAAIAVGTNDVEDRFTPPRILTTGDSMMQGIDGFLGDDLGDAASVRSDVRPGTAIGKSLDWLTWSASQASSLRPAATVVAIGANEGWPMQTPVGEKVECCGEPWEAEYVRRVRTMMQSYLRRGRGRVVWLTLPLPSGERLTPIFEAVNRAILRAGAGLENVSVLRMDTLFTPQGFREEIRYRGATVRVREPDGVHLNVAGTAIAATIIAEELRGTPGRGDLAKMLRDR